MANLNTVTSHLKMDCFCPITDCLQKRNGNMRHWDSSEIAMANLLKSVERIHGTDTTSGMMN